eukprot:TRINITY_DN77436_c0_g1_i1.p1 TRINITY_DN77436_c0_g1~~TRINITY_DN77436_c0_g1_i1.p1  ORF type:complete len:151 (-),score=26.13 TRINITY_DN77436_c0_g1_i1:157-609(-)
MFWFSLTLLSVLLPARILGCPDGWTSIKNSCYIYISNPSNWIDAQVICGFMGGHLPEIESATENWLLKNKMRALRVSKVLIGFNDLEHEGKHVWTSTKKPLRYVNWGREQPNNLHYTTGDQDCGSVNSDGTWDDVQCEDGRHTFFCEKPQ